ncbi:hemolysin III family protein [Sulfurospirillum sp. 1307]|jgi:hemolysin III
MENLSKRYTQIEEVWHSVTHGIGVVLSIVGLCILVAYSAIKGSSISIVSSAIFGATLIIAYSSSTLYHAITNEKAKQVFRQFDHASIYLLIAGTYTPITLVSLGGTLGWSIFLIIWSIAIVGVLLEFLYPNRFKKLSLVLYLGMGWLIVVAIGKILETMDTNGFILMLLGGIFYSVGVVFYVKKSIPYNHIIWHIFVLLGSMSHYLMTLFYVV